MLFLTIMELHKLTLKFRLELILLFSYYFMHENKETQFHAN